MVDTGESGRQLRDRVSSKEVWLRGPFMLLFAVIWAVAEMVLFATAIVQFGFALLAGAPNARLRRFGLSLAAFFRDVARFLTYATDEKPFPFRDWPDGPEEPT
jgi:hypothetical protein